MNEIDALIRSIESKLGIGRTDARKYTVDEAIKNLTAIEGHALAVREFGDVFFCLECIRKHLYSVWMLADEGVTFFRKEPEVWRRLGGWAKTYVDRLKTEKDLETHAEDLKAEARNFRKELDEISLRLRRGDEV